MTDEDLPGDLPAEESTPLQKSRWSVVWQSLSQAGLAEAAFLAGCLGYARVLSPGTDR
jgi:hypothetical protein